jgi:Contractile injection system tube protein
MPTPASFRVEGQAATAFAVMFNPASLKITLTNRLQDEETGPSGAGGGGGQGRQATRGTTTKLETELVFDTTGEGMDGTVEVGTDVREYSNRLKALARAPEGDHPRPPAVEFRWGRFSYVGFIESLNETLDFWSAEGVPLRSTVQLVLQGRGSTADTLAADAPAKATLNTIPQGGTGTTGAAQRAGDPAAGRALAAANGLESMRPAAGGVVAVSAGVQLRAAAAFSAGASAGAGIGIGAGVAAGASAGFGIGASAGASAGLAAGASAAAGFGASASAGLGASASAGFGASASAGFGASASAGVSAAGGAFAGLGVSKTASASYRLDPGRLLTSTALPVVGAGTQFDLTGRAVTGSSAGLSADVRGTAAAGVRLG